jgi:PAP2 superfamily
MTGSTTVVTSDERDVPPGEGLPGRWRRLWGSAAWVREAVLVGAVDELYEVTRSLAPTRVGKAFANAHAIERLEQALHLNVERPLNHALLDVTILIPPISVYYQVGHLVALLAALIWAWCRHRDLYRAARNALLALTLGGLAWYWLMPTAPPRFALPGVVDVVAAHPVLLASQESVVGLVNEYAAMPSLHVAWAVWVALTVTGLSARRVRWVAWVHPAATTLVVLATANHYLLDAVAGAVLALLAWLLAGPGGPLAPAAGLGRRPRRVLAGRRPADEDRRADAR